jgi:hypothetical protein
MEKPIFINFDIVELLPLNSGVSNWDSGVVAACDFEILDLISASDAHWFDHEVRYMYGTIR